MCIVDAGIKNDSLIISNVYLFTKSSCNIRDNWINILQHLSPYGGHDECECVVFVLNLKVELVYFSSVLCFQLFSCGNFFIGTYLKSSATMNNKESSWHIPYNWSHSVIDMAFQASCWRPSVSAALYCWMLHQIYSLLTASVTRRWVELLLNSEL